MFSFEKECGLEIIKDIVKGDKTLSRIYGFILYTDQDPYVVKVLRDEVFWNALNSISGANWPIFAVRPLRKGNYSLPSDNDSLISDETINLFKRYREIERCFKTSGVSMTPQRCMYVLYLSYYKKRKDYATIIKEIELFAQEYKEDNKLDRAVSRVFIYAPFKKALDKRYGISECDLLNLE
jgi:hypothetical protein